MHRHDEAVLAVAVVVGDETERRRVDGRDRRVRREVELLGHHIDDRCRGMVDVDEVPTGIEQVDLELILAVGGGRRVHTRRELGAGLVLDKVGHHPLALRRHTRGDLEQIGGRADDLRPERVHLEHRRRRPGRLVRVVSVDLTGERHERTRRALAP